MVRNATGQLRIVSHSGLPFADREEAGKFLAAELSQYRGQKPAVLGILRGGIVVAREIARALNGELDIVLAHKLRTPGHEELAMGAVAEDGRLFLNTEVTVGLGVEDVYIQQEKARQVTEIKRRRELFRRVRPKVTLKARIVIVADDGVATGATTQAALWAARLEKPQKLIAAIPVGPEETITRLAEAVDEMVCLRVPSFFTAVGQFYIRFQPVEDEEVLEILKGEQQRGTGE